VTKIGLMTCAHTHPYNIQWLNNSDKAKVTHTSRIHFYIGTYHDYADYDVTPMQACSLLLCCPWEFDTDVVHCHTPFRERGNEASIRVPRMLKSHV
jgi:hypothetical protein